MRIKRGINANNFLSAARQCAGSVTLATEKGDRFELHSDLAGLLVAILSEEPEQLYGAEITCADEEDYKRLAHVLE